MPAPELIEENPPPLNPKRDWPYVVEPFPAEDVLKDFRGEVKDVAQNAQRKEP